MDNAPANPLLIVCKKKGGKKAEKEGKGEGKVGQSEKKISTNVYNFPIYCQISTKKISLAPPPALHPVYALSKSSRKT